VTIAIGFVHDEGLLLCADTKVTGIIKANQSKIEHWHNKDRDCSLSFAISSEDLNFPKTAIKKCCAFVKKMDPKTITLESVHDAAEFSLAEFYREHIYAHPDRTPCAVFLELLVAISVRGEMGLYVSHETVLNPVEIFECVGSGAYLAKYLIGKYSSANPGRLTHADAVVISRYAVQSAIDYDQNCGGTIEILNVGVSGVPKRTIGTDWYPTQDFVSGALDAVLQMTHDLANMSAEDHWGEATDKRIDEVAKRLHDLDMNKWNW
jgi:hypothetical protein